MTAEVSLSSVSGDSLRTAFPTLVKLSIQRVLYGSDELGQEELSLGVGAMLAMLAVPEGVVSLFLLNKYSSFLQWLRGENSFDPLSAAMPDEYFFIVISMVVTAGVALWWWDRIFPDRTDFSNLGHLPLPTSMIFKANCGAILILTCICALDVNAVSSVLFPLVVGGTGSTFGFVAHFAFVHALVVILASIFGFCAVFACSGILLLLPYATFRKLSIYVRTLLAAALVSAASTSFVIPDVIRQLPNNPRSSVRFLPSAWFLGLCQIMHGVRDPYLLNLANTGLTALASVVVVTIITYAIAYDRCFSRLPELSDRHSGVVSARISGMWRVFDLFVFRSPLHRAGYRFILKTIGRSEAHALCLGGFLSLGVVFASEKMLPNVGAPAGLDTTSLLSVPFILGFSALLGFRVVFDIPVSLRANWIFCFLLDGSSLGETVGLAERIMLCCATCIASAAAPIYVFYLGWTGGLAHLLMLAMWLILLTEVLLIHFNKLPFTCMYPPFQPSAAAMITVWLIGYFVFSNWVPVLDIHVLTWPKGRYLFPVFVIAATCALRLIRRVLLEPDMELIFGGEPVASFQLLHLSQGR
jgi:hypothetical protein